MPEVTWDWLNNVSLLVHELTFFPRDNAIRQGELTREEMSAGEWGVGVEWAEEDKNTY